MAKTYYEKLQDPKWQKKRLEILERDNWKCTQCGEGGQMLHVHHGYYTSNKNPWDYPIETLHTVCSLCHERYEEIKHDVHFELGKLSIKELEAALPKVRKSPIKKKQTRVKIPSLAELKKETSKDNLLTIEDKQSIWKYCTTTKPAPKDLFIYLKENYPEVDEDLKRKIFESCLYNDVAFFTNTIFTREVR